MDEYLKTLLEQIRCKKINHIRQELQNHMEDQIEANIHAGMDYRVRKKEAVKDMGDPVEAGISLDRIHKPQICMEAPFMIALISGWNCDAYNDCNAYGWGRCILLPVDM